MRDEVRRVLQQAIHEKLIPGAIISVSKGGKNRLREVIGNRQVYPNCKPMELDTVIDLASLTKVVATLPALLFLLDKNEIQLDDPIVRYIPKFSQNRKDTVTIRHLLTHTSGLPAFYPFFQERLTKQEVLERICLEKLKSPSGTTMIYSDLGFMLLSFIVETVTQQPFSEFVRDTIFQPLHMHDTGFSPDYPKFRFAATEYNQELGEYKRGIVHDENAEIMGGISGHAGLFSTLADLEKFANMIEGNEQSLLTSSIMKLSRENMSPPSCRTRGLGWELNHDKKASCGTLFSKESYGHTGFTGTSIWFDPEMQLHVILLTNHVHLGRKPEQMQLLRKKIHTAIRSFM